MERLIELSLNLLIGIGIGFCIVYLRKLIDTLVEMRLVSAGNAFWCLSLGMFVLSLMITIPLVYWKMRLLFPISLLGGLPIVVAINRQRVSEQLQPTIMLFRKYCYRRKMAPKGSEKAYFRFQEPGRYGRLAQNRLAFAERRTVVGRLPPISGRRGTFFGRELCFGICRLAA